MPRLFLSRTIEWKRHGRINICDRDEAYTRGISDDWGGQVNYYTSSAYYTSLAATAYFTHTYETCYKLDLSGHLQLMAKFRELLPPGKSQAADAVTNAVCTHLAVAWLDTSPATADRHSLLTLTAVLCQDCQRLYAFLGDSDNRLAYKGGYLRGDGHTGGDGEVEAHPSSTS